jgi:meiotically up-regulated gene 157 (Mug157) protein
VTLVLQVLESRKNPSPWDYSFLRTTTTPTDTLVKGVGQRFKPTGMLASPFRPSDDATTFPFLVPANAMVAVELNRTAEAREFRIDVLC